MGGGKATSTPEALKRDESNGWIEPPDFPVLILHIRFASLLMRDLGPAVDQRTPHGKQIVFPTGD